MKFPFKFLYGQFMISLEELIKYTPGHLGTTLRYKRWRDKCRECGEDIHIETGITITSAQNIELGNHIRLMARSYLNAYNGGSIKVGNRVNVNTNVRIDAAEKGEIIIGNDVLIGPNVVIRASNHVYDRVDIPIREQGHSGGKIVIEDDVWIGANVVITPNVIIGKGAVVAAGAVVVHSVDSYHVVGGVPAKTIANRKVR